MVSVAKQATPIREEKSSVGIAGSVITSDCTRALSYRSQRVPLGVLGVSVTDKPVEVFWVFLNFS